MPTSHCADKHIMKHMTPSKHSHSANYVYWSRAIQADFLEETPFLVIEVLFWKPTLSKYQDLACKSNVRLLCYDSLATPKFAV